MRRREFLALAGAYGAVCDVLTRRVEVETVFDAPGAQPHPNGLQATPEGLWVYNQTGPPSRVYLLRYEDCKMLRSFETEADRGGGITFDGEAIWISSSYACKILRVDAHTGKTLAAFDCPGIGVVDWPHPRTSPLAHRRPVAAQSSVPPPKKGSGHRQKTGSHGMEWRDGKLWFVVPPAKTVYRVDPKTFEVEHTFPSAGDRPHGVGWAGNRWRRWFWCVDTNLNAIFKHDPATGEITEKIQRADRDPLPHGMTIWKGTMWYCDDIGVICRLKASFGA